MAAAVRPAGAAQDTIKIGEINSYKAQPAFLEPYKKGWSWRSRRSTRRAACSASKIEVIIRDDNGNPGDAVRVAEELLTREKVLADRRLPVEHGSGGRRLRQAAKMLFLAAEPLTDKIVWQNGNHYTFRLRPSTYMQAAMLVPEAVKLNKKRWAIVYPNYEYGQSAVATFKKLLKQRSPTSSSSPSRPRRSASIDAGAVVQALADAKPDAIFNVEFGADLAKFVREGNTRGLFKDREVCQSADRRTGVHRAAEGRGAGRLDRHRLSVVRHRDRRAQEVLPRLLGASTTSIRDSARWSATRRIMSIVDGHQKGEVDRSPKSWSPPSAACRSPRRSARSPIAPSTTSRPWAPTSARPSVEGRQGRDDRLRAISTARTYLPSDAEVKKLRPADD